MLSNKNLEKTMQKAIAGLSDLRDEQEVKQFKKLWGEISVPFTLQEGLSRFTKYELDDIRKTHQIPNASSLKKAELISVLVGKIPAMGDLYLIWDKERFGLITKIAEYGGHLSVVDLEWDQVEYLRTTGLIYSGTYQGKQILAVPQELIDPIKELAKDAEVQSIVSRNTVWIKLTKGLLYYYGTLSFTTLIDMIEKHTGETLPLREYLNVIHEAISYREDIHIEEAGFSNSRVFDPQRVLQEHQARSEVPFYPFTKQELLKAGVTDFVERNKSYEQLVSFLLKNFAIERDGADEVAEECVYAAKNGLNPNDVMQFLSQTFEFDSLDTIQEMMNRVVQLMNNTRQWFLKGHTPVELGREERKHLQPVPSAGAAHNGPREVEKIGRNEPCPCGSGKKYKKCCGR